MVSSDAAGFARPVLVVSRCLGFEACRFDGAMLGDAFIRSLDPFVEFRPVCPEADIGLGTPRDPIRLVEGKGSAVRLIQPASLRDLTQEMTEYSARWLGDLSAVDGFLLKSRSPSCAIRDAKVYAKPEPSPGRSTRPGLFAEAVLERFPHAAVEDEGRLTNLEIRHHFLTKLFTMAEFRTRVRPAPRPIRALVEFQSRHKYLLMSYHQTVQRELGRIVANHSGHRPADVVDAYAEALGRAFARAPRFTSNINVLQHAFGYVSPELESRERRYFEGLLERYRARSLPLSALLSALLAWVVRFDVEYLLEQSFFLPYPEPLLDLADSGKSTGIRHRI